MKEKAMQGKSYERNPHVQFDEGAGVLACPGCSALLYKVLRLDMGFRRKWMLAGFAAAFLIG